MITKRISPPNLQFFISDASLPENPVQGETIGIISNGVCLSVPCAYWDETETTLIIGRPEEVSEPAKPLFDGTIPTHSGAIVFSDSELAELLSYPVSDAVTRIQIWTDGLKFPERMVVAIG